MPFKHDVAGGSGSLNIQALKSPNYVHGSTGWAINKDGTAEFHDVSLPAGSGGTVVTFSSTAPTTPNTGDVWYDTASGLEAFVWSGTSWVAYQIGAGAIAAGTIVAGIINGTTVNAATFTGSVFEGTDFIFNSSGAFFYSGTPAAGNLIASIASVGGTDGNGNTYLAGITSYGSASEVARLTPTGVLSLDYGANISGAFLEAANGQLEIASPLLSTDTGGANLWLCTANGGTLGYAYTQVSAPLVATQPGTTASPETWHTMTLTSGWSAGTDVNGATYTPAYRLNADGSLSLRGTLVTPSSGTVTGVVFANIGSSYGNTYSNPPTATITNTSGGQTGIVYVKSTGNLYLGGAFGNTINVHLDCTLRIT